MSKFLLESEAATFNDYTQYLTTVEEFHEKVRKCDASKNNKEWLTEVLRQITGENHEDSIVVKQLVNPLNAKLYIDFFVLFKLISRMAYLGAAIKKMQL